MITLYSGTPGSGKSLHCAQTMCNWSRIGDPIICNFPADLSRYKKSKFYYVPNDLLSPEYLISFSREWFKDHKFSERGILLVIDECQLLFNAREWNVRGRSEWLSFFTQHRKYGYDIILIAQFDRMVDRQIRSLVEYEYMHRKMSNFGIGGKILSIVFGGNTFLCVKRWYPLHEKIGMEMFHARKKLYSIYNSYSTFETQQAEGE